MTTSRTNGSEPAPKAKAARAKTAKRTRTTAAKKTAVKAKGAAETSVAETEAVATKKVAKKAAAKKTAVKKAGAKKTAAKKPATKKAAKKSATKKTAASGSLVIVESPAKSRTLTKFLGRGFTVLASMGHVMDLPKSKLGVNLENGFEPEYVQIRGKGPAVSKIKAAAKNAERVYLAPDPDREGEAIAWHLATILEKIKVPLHRLTFNEITERAVKTALETPRELDFNLVNAQQARRVLDRLVGYKVSPFVWRTVRYGLSAGRVQSVALRLVCEREDAINAFKPVEYWTIEVDYQTEKGDRFTSRLVKVGDQDLEQGQIRGDRPEEEARAYAADLAKLPGEISKVETTPRQVHPKPPFITSTLQQAAYNRLGFTSQRTMALAQQLYEGLPIGDEGSVGLITYMRTDSTRLAGEAIAEMREWLGANLGEQYVPKAPRTFRSRKQAQDAHEAVRPTSVARTPDSVRAYLTPELFKLYDLIWKRGVSSQAASAEYLATTIEVKADRYGLRAAGRVLKFPGFQKLYGLDEEDDASENRLPEVTQGLPLNVSDTPLGEKEEPVRPDQHFTQPPPRYTEASLVRSLEEENIGRPSTYASIVGTIVSRDYVEREKGRLNPTELGMAVNGLLVETFPDIFNVKFTAAMEEELDEIEEGKQEWHRVVQDFWAPFSKDLAAAEKSADEHRKKLEETVDIDCENCGKKLVRKFGRRGPFLACPGYPECKYTRPVDDSDLPTPVEGKCDLCGSSLVARNGPFGRFISCSTRPDCKFTKPFTLGIKCPECGEGEMAERRTRRGKIFYGCTTYPKCTFAVWDKPRDTPCPQCEAPFLVEKETKKGLTVRCPKCKASFDPESLAAGA